MKFEDQIKNLKLEVITKPREFIKWDNTEKGRDKDDCYERIDYGHGIVIYVNNNNRNLSILRENPFWNVLESMYQKEVSKKENKSSSIADLNHIVINSAMNIMSLTDNEQNVQNECGKIIDAVRSFTKNSI